MHMHRYHVTFSSKFWDTLQIHAMLYIAVALHHNLNLQLSNQMELTFLLGKELTTDIGVSIAGNGKGSNEHLIGNPWHC